MVELIEVPIGGRIARPARQQERSKVQQAGLIVYWLASGQQMSRHQMAERLGQSSTCVGALIDELSIFVPIAEDEDGDGEVFSLERDGPP